MSKKVFWIVAMCLLLCGCASGDKYKIGYRGFGTIYLEKVDMLL